jgi:hypothetical protein
MTALAGAAADFPIFHGTLAEFVLGDPFHESSRWIKEGYVHTHSVANAMMDAEIVKQASMQ